MLQDVFDEVLFARLPDGQDPAALYAANRGLLRDALESARPLAEFAIEVELSKWRNVLDHISGQVNAIRAVAPLVANLPAARIADQVARLARAVHLDEQIVSKEVVEAVGRCPDRRPRGRRRPCRGADVELDPAEISRSP